MNNIGILDIIAVYGSAFIILLLLIATFVIRIIRENKRKSREQTAVYKAPAADTAKPATFPLNGSETPDRMLPTLELYTDKSKQNGVIKNIERLPTLKRGILWAEILGRPGGRRRRNT